MLYSLWENRTMYQFCYILIVDFKGATSNICNIKQKGTEYSTGYRVLPKHLGKFTWHGEDEALLLRSLQSGNFDYSEFQLSEHFIKANSSFPRTTVDWTIFAFVKLTQSRWKTNFGREFFQAHIVLLIFI